ncbi:MAG: ParB N-terminal domain-containing protein [Desulfobacterales bacterium]|nr:ParB N-terminal domain-containing protein [Desulfobacterales bacterium]
MQLDGLIEPIVVWPNGESYQLIAGERRWRAIRDYTDMKTIAARIINASDLQARRMSAAENLQRKTFPPLRRLKPSWRSWMPN